MHVATSHRRAKAKAILNVFSDNQESDLGVLASYLQAVASRDGSTQGRRRLRPPTQKGPRVAWVFFYDTYFWHFTPADIRKLHHRGPVFFRSKL